MTPQPDPAKSLNFTRSKEDEEKIEKIAARAIAEIPGLDEWENHPDFDHSEMTEGDKWLFIKGFKAAMSQKGER